jgi:predicted HTH transcriptional regulator
MSNRRDGGLVIVGVSDTNGQLSISGVKPDDLPTWQYDHIAAGLAPYADPYVAFESEVVTVDGHAVVVVTIREFDDVPVLCRRDYGTTLRDGACYVRPFRKPETSEIPTFADMRELLDIATAKQVGKLLRQMADAGAIIFPTAAPPEPSDDEQFNKQAEI